MSRILSGINQRIKTDGSKVKETLGQLFLSAEPLMNTLMVALASSGKFPLQHNLIAYGDGGYGKSEIIRALLDELELPYVIYDFSKGTTEEVVNGGYNLRKWTDEGNLEFNLHNSLYAHPVVIIEEGLSAPSGALASMRNALTSRQVNQNGKPVDVVTEFIAICTNESPSAHEGDSSMMAFLQRFPNVINVSWDHISESQRLENYQSLMSRNFSLDSLSASDKDLVLLSLVAAKASPRQALLCSVSMQTRQEIFGYVNVADVLISMNLHDADIQSLRQASARSMLDEKIASIDKGIHSTLSNLVAQKGNKSNALIGPAMSLVIAAQSQLSDVLKRSEAIAPGITNGYVAKQQQLSNLKKQIWDLGAEAYFKELGIEL